MPRIQTISTLLGSTGSQYRIFDMGRRVTKLTHHGFFQFEEALSPYPYPLQRHAWLGILCWSPRNTKDQAIWFVKLPLDEQGLLKQSARNDFLRRMLEEPDQPQEKMPDNPWGFQPGQDKMACFHSRARMEMGMPPSPHLDQVLNYLHKNSTDNWQTLALQGIAEIVAHWKEHSKVLENAMPWIPEPVFISLCQCLENEDIDHRLVQAVTQRADTNTCHRIVAASIRAISNARASTLRKEFLQKILASPERVNIEILASIAGRCWQDLEITSINQPFLEALARNDSGQEAFNQVLLDLLFLTNTGPALRQTFRNPDRSEQLAQAIGSFLNGVR